MDLLARQHWDFPIPIHYGLDSRLDIANYCKSVGMRAPLVVTDRGSAALTFVPEMMTSLHEHGLHANLFSNIDSNPTDSNVSEAIDAFHTSHSDSVIALGGGSGMDAGKAVSFIAPFGSEVLWDFDFTRLPPSVDPADFLPLICVPTTAGTGAETDCGAIITDTRAAVKRCVWHHQHKPSMAILDPVLTVSLPKQLTAWTGCDALIHALEAFVVPQFHPLCDGIALQAIELVSGSLQQAVSQGDDLEARAAMLTGSCLAGIAFKKGLGLVHSISHMVGAVYDTHHGLTNAVLLPSVLLFNQAAIEEKIPAMSQALGLKTEDFDSFYRAIVMLLDDLAIPDSLAAIGVEEEQVKLIAEKTMTDICLPTNPRPVSVTDVETLLYSALERAR